MHLAPSYTHSLNRQRDLNNCTEVIRQSRDAYDVTELFSTGTNHILQLAYAVTQNLFRDTNNAPSPAHRVVKTPFTNLRVTGWVHAFLKHPRAYLLLSTCIDSSLATGHLPPDGSSLPAIVRQTVPLTLGVSKLPWTIDAPGRLGHKRQRIVRSCSHDGGTSRARLDDTWYWTLLHNREDEGSASDCQAERSVECLPEQEEQGKDQEETGGDNLDRSLDFFNFDTFW